MKKSHIYTILLVLVSININYAQEGETDIQSTQAGDANNMLFNTSGTLFSFDNSDKSIRGSVYIQDIFMPAKLSLLDGAKILKLKYNAYNDEIEIENEGQKPNALNKNIDNLLITFVGDNKTYEAIDYINDEGNTSRGYFVHVNVNNAKSKHKLLIKEAVKFVDKIPAKTGYDKAKPAQFKRLSDTYFISNGDNPAVEFPKKKKDLSKIFPEKYDNISNFMKENKIKTSKTEDLETLINYINTL